MVSWAMCTTMSRDTDPYVMVLNVDDVKGENRRIELSNWRAGAGEAAKAMASKLVKSSLVWRWRSKRVSSGHKGYCTKAIMEGM